MSEFHYMNKFISRFGVMNFAHVEFEDAYLVQDVTGKQGKQIALEPEKVAELKQALLDKMENKIVPEKSALEIQNELLMARIERLEAREIPQIPVEEPEKKPVRKPVKKETKF